MSNLKFEIRSVSEADLFHPIEMEIKVEKHDEYQYIVNNILCQSMYNLERLQHLWVELDDIDYEIYDNYGHKLCLDKTLIQKDISQLPITQNHSVKDGTIIGSVEFRPKDDIFNYVRSSQIKLVNPNILISDGIIATIPYESEGIAKINNIKVMTGKSRWPLITAFTINDDDTVLGIELHNQGIDPKEWFKGYVHEKIPQFIKSATVTSEQSIMLDTVSATAQQGYSFIHTERPVLLENILRYENAFDDVVLLMNPYHYGQDNLPLLAYSVDSSVTDGKKYVESLLKSAIQRWTNAEIIIIK